MNQATLAWTAFKNMMRQAARDPVWAFVALIISPFRGGLYLLKVGFFIGLVALALVGLLHLAIPQDWIVARWAARRHIPVERRRPTGLRRQRSR
ncbi:MULTISPECIES: hypothetical protein [Alphaproteobacteria]|jgi:type IV secretion system protein VirD4|uniref:hypothetical protein n=1 Tax=Alphaproteobacteria TaxID=28211 RepID=UPI00045AA251|nr:MULTISPECIES: hypothetical protein [Alphaproteobacteria]CDN96453.1 Type IV secretory pathway, VirD4 component [Agrobacterium tumefaciens]